MLETKLIMFRHEKHFFCPSGFSVSQPSSPCGKMDASLQWQREHQVLAALLQRMLSTNPISETFLFPEAGIFTAAAFPTLLDTAPAIALPTEVILQGYFWFVNGKNAAFRRPFQHIFFSPHLPHNLPHTLGFIGVKSLIHPVLAGLEQLPQTCAHGQNWTSGAFLPPSCPSGELPPPAFLSCGLGSWEW